MTNILVKNQDVDDKEASEKVKSTVLGSWCDQITFCLAYDPQRINRGSRNWNSGSQIGRGGREAKKSKILCKYPRLINFLSLRVG